MAFDLAALQVNVDGSKATASVKKVAAELDRMGERGAAAGRQAAGGMVAVERAAGSLYGSLLKLAAAFGGIAVAVATFKRALEAAAEQETAWRRLAATLEATGNRYGWTVKELANMAGALQQQTGIADNVINRMQALLLTFDKIGRDIFPEAQKAIIDVSTALEVDLTTAARMVGRALQEPAIGVQMLSRYGIVLSRSQQEVIKRLAETGRTAEAQRKLLDEINARYGGMADALNRGLVPALKLLKTNWDDVLERFGAGVMASENLESAIRRLAAFLADNETLRSAQSFGETLRDWLITATETFVKLYRVGADAFDNLKVLLVSFIATVSAQWKIFVDLLTGGWDMWKDAAMAVIRVVVGTVVDWFSWGVTNLLDVSGKLLRAVGLKSWAGNLEGVQGAVEEMKAKWGKQAQIDAMVQSGNRFMLASIQREQEAQAIVQVAMDEALQRQMDRAAKTEQWLKTVTRFREELQKTKGEVQIPEPRPEMTRVIPPEVEGQAMRLIDLFKRIREERQGAFRSLKFDEAGLITEDSLEQFKARMEEVQKMLQQVQLQIEAGMLSVSDSVAAGFALAVDKFGNLQQRAAQIGEQIASTLDTQMTDAFASIVDGTKSVQEAFADMGRAIVSEITRVVVQLMVVRPLLQSFGGMFGLNLVPAPVAHTGGVVGAIHAGRFVRGDAWDLAPHYQTGGFAAHEVPIVAHRGEVILNEDQMRKLVAGRSSAPKVEIVNVVDPSAVDERLAANPGAVLNVISRHRQQVRAMLGMRY